MSIRVVCSNGHVLKVKDELAGKLGLCPVCKARVQVPGLGTEALSEDAILDMMDQPLPLSASGRHEISPTSRSAGGKKDPQSTPKKTCIKCKREITASMHICPFCHTYIAQPRDF